MYYLPVCMAFCASCLTVFHLSDCLWVIPFVHPSVCPALSIVGPSVLTFVSLSVRASVDPSVCVFVCLCPLLISLSEIVLVNSVFIVHALRSLNDTNNEFWCNAFFLIVYIWQWTYYFSSYTIKGQRKTRLLTIRNIPKAFLTQDESPRILF